MASSSASICSMHLTRSSLLFKNGLPVAWFLVYSSVNPKYFCHTLWMETLLEPL